MGLAWYFQRRSHRCFNEGTWGLGIVSLTPKFHRGGPHASAAPTGNSCNTPSRSPLSSHMTNHSFSAGFRAISQRGHDRSSPGEVKHTPSHPTQACYCSGPYFIWSYKNNWAAKISDPMSGGWSIRELSHGIVHSLVSRRFGLESLIILNIEAI